MNLLIVEDNPGDAELVRAYLEESGEGDQEVEHVEQLNPALDVDREGLEVVLLDLNLPDASPDETIAAIESWSDDAAVVVMTGRPRSDLEARALEAGAAEFLSKSRLDSRLLRRRLDHAVRRHEMLTALRRRERELERYRVVVEHATDAVHMKDASGRFRLANKRFEELFDRSGAGVVGRTASDVYETGEVEPVKERDRKVLEDGDADEHERERETKQGTRTMVTTRIPYETDGKVEGTISISRDVTERREMHEELERQALYDRLSGLPNRTLFRDRLRQTIERAIRNDTSFGVAFLDIDDFKDINDSLGHQAGDELLQAVGERLVSVVRGEDTVARVGGDEFTLVLQSIEGVNDLESTGQRIRDAFERPFVLQDAEVYVDLSIGFTIPTRNLLGTDSFQTILDSVVNAADRAMYRAKEIPSTRWRIARSQTKRGDEGVVQRENRIRTGIVRREFEPHFQPIVRVPDGDVVGFEMLARWRHPDRGMVGPGNFIPVAEKSTLMDDLTTLLVERACESLAAAEGELPDGTALLVNVSAPQIERPDVLERLEDRFDEGLPETVTPILEVTETAILRHEQDVARLRATGMRVFVDDFGTGHSSLSRLKQMPADGLKLDMEFVQGVTESRADAAIVETVNRLAEQLDLSVVAEGVETRAQLQFLREVGCPVAQGYFFAEPSPLEAIIESVGASGLETSSAGSSE